jgi:broad-specificity NMP kinase
MSGAKMLPSSPALRSPEGEVKIFEMLRDDPGAKNWIVIHDLDEANHVCQVSGQADFVVLIPDNGIVVIEVKGCHMLKTNEHGWFYGNDPVPDKRGPFKQAAMAMHSMREHLARNNLAHNVPMISAVVFPYIDPQINRPIEWHDWQLVGLSKLNARSISQNILHIIKSAQRHFASRGFNWAQGKVCTTQVVPAITASLRPYFTFLVSPHERRKGLDGNLKRCTEQQFEFIDQLGSNERILVSGLAGTGKTTLALEAVRRSKDKNPEEFVALFCFNKLLGAALKSEQEAIGGKRLRMSGFHQFLMEISEIPHGSKETEQPHFWSDILPSKVFDLLRESQIMKGELDFLVLDEAQDLIRENYLVIFDWLLKGGLSGGRWLAFGDFERQAIYKAGSKADEVDLLYVGMSRSLHRLVLLCHINSEPYIRHRLDQHSQKKKQARSNAEDSMVDTLSNQWAKGRCAKLRLDVNCRNTQEISENITVLANLVAPARYSKTLRADTHAEDVTIIFYSSPEDQVDKASKILSETMAQGTFKPEDIVLLSPREQGSLASILAGGKKWASRLQPFAHDKECLRYATVHSFKGLESPVVLLTDIENLSAPDLLTA